MSKRSDEPLGRNGTMRALLLKSEKSKPSLWRQIILYFQGVDWRTTARIEEIK